MRTAVAFLMLLMSTNNAWAMHIAEGILPFNWAVLWFVLSAPFFIYGLYRLKMSSSIDVSYKPLVGLLAAVVFIISCMPIPVPTAGTCSHPAGTAISAIILGPFVSVVVATAALLIQALFLAHGGLSTLGANVFAMGVAGSFAGYLVFRALRGVGAGLPISGFFAGLAADWLTYLVTSAELASGLMGEGEFMGLFTKIVIAFIPTQLPIGIVEGAMTAGVVTVLYKKRPDLLMRMRVLKVPSRQILLLVLAVVMFIPQVSLSSEKTEEKWKGVDEAVIEKFAQQQGREAKEHLINTDTGDLLLFVFLLAGTVGGFVAGYYWRVLLEQKRPTTLTEQGEGSR